MSVEQAETLEQTEHPETNAMVNSENLAKTAETHAETQEAEHEHTLYAETIGHIGSMPITNSLLNSWLIIIIVLILGITIKLKLKTIPRGIQNGLEAIIEGFLNIFDGVTNDHKKSLKFAPFVLAFFFFILF